jgi:type II secretory pathway pseudopilin PulG
MLVVVSIILLVAVVALPGISSLSKSASRRNSVSLVLGALDAARMTAVSQSCNSFIVFANGDTSIPEAYRYRAFAIFQETYIPVSDDKPLANPYHLMVVRPWTLLPEGVAFRPEITAGGAAPGGTGGTDPDSDGNQSVFTAPKASFFCKPADTNVDLPYIEFNSIGAVELKPTVSPSSPEGGGATPAANPITTNQARIKLFEGYINASGAAVATNAAKALADDTITVSLFTGRAKREELKKQ